VRVPYSPVKDRFFRFRSLAVIFKFIPPSPLCQPLAVNFRSKLSTAGSYMRFSLG